MIEMERDIIVLGMVNDQVEFMSHILLSADLAVMALLLSRHKKRTGWLPVGIKLVTKLD